MNNNNFPDKISNMRDDFYKYKEPIDKYCAIYYNPLFDKSHREIIVYLNDISLTKNCYVYNDIFCHYIAL